MYFLKTSKILYKIILIDNHWKQNISVFINFNTLYIFLKERRRKKEKLERRERNLILRLKKIMIHIVTQYLII